MSDLFYKLQETIHDQRNQLLRDGVKPDAVLLGPTAWRIVEGHIRDQNLANSRPDEPMKLAIPQIATIGPLRVIRTIDENILVVQTSKP